MHIQTSCLLGRTLQTGMRLLCTTDLGTLNHCLNIIVLGYYQGF